MVSRVLPLRMEPDRESRDGESAIAQAERIAIDWTAWEMRMPIHLVAWEAGFAHQEMRIHLVP